MNGSIKSNVKTAVVILNWNGLGFLQKFLPILIENTPTDLGTIFVADNGSTDGSLQWLVSNHPDVVPIAFEQNYGFTGGYNRAFRAIEGSDYSFDYYLLLNSDVEVTSGWLSQLLEFMEANPKVGISSPKVLSFYRRDYFEHAGACGGLIDFFGFPYCRGRVLSRVEKDEGQYDTPAEVFWASGTSFMVRASLWRRLGGLDENFFAHMEEIDFCWRAKLLGEQVWVVPSSVIYHVGGGTLPNNSPHKLFLNYRNNLLMMYKNLPQRSRGLILFLRMVLDGCSAIIYLLTGRVSFYKAVIRAHKEYKSMRHIVKISEVVTPIFLPKKFLFFQ